METMQRLHEQAIQVEALFQRAAELQIFAIVAAMIAAALLLAWKCRRSPAPRRSALEAYGLPSPAKPDGAASRRH